MNKRIICILIAVLLVLGMVIPVLVSVASKLYQ